MLILTTYCFKVIMGSFPALHNHLLIKIIEVEQLGLSTLSLTIMYFLFGGVLLFFLVKE
ncbi:MAG: hypothetical protein ACRBBP_10635 [Bdellovibrionales bacterium]